MALSLPRFRRFVRRRVRRALGHLQQLPGLGLPDGTFESTGGRSFRLYAGYRDVAKPTWRKYWWQTRLLIDLHGTRPKGLPSWFDDVIAELLGSHTLPRPLDFYTEAALEAARSCPQDVLDSEGGARFEVRGDAHAVASASAYYEASAAAIVEKLRRYGFVAEGARVIEIGSASGALPLAFAALGSESIGVDLSIEQAVPGSGLALLRQRLAKGRFAELIDADARELPFADETVDLVLSISTVEHLSDTEAVFTELRRVTRPNGLAYHSVHPWFGPTGGHALCSLDFPWGHVQLSDSDVGRYLLEVRTHEAEEATSHYRSAFQHPRLTLDELKGVIERCGFAVLECARSDTDPRYRRLAPHALPAAREIYPAVTTADLLSDAYQLVLRAIDP